MYKDTNIVAYHNDMNVIPLRKFNAVEQNLLYSICIRMRDENTAKAVISFEEIKKICSYDRNSTIQEFVKELESVYSKLLSITCRFVENEIIKGFVLFIDYEIDPNKQTVQIRVNDRFTYFLNNLTNNFTKFEMLEFSELRSSYSKTAYRFLKQFRQTGYLVFNIDKFKDTFDIPNSYRMCDIDTRVLKPIKKELVECFEDLEISKVSRGKGKKITHIEFTFEPQIDVNKGGSMTFRDKKTGKYYNKQIGIDELTKEELSKKFKNAPEPMAERYNKSNMDERKKQMKFFLSAELPAERVNMMKKWLKDSPKDKELMKEVFRELQEEELDKLLT